MNKIKSLLDRPTRKAIEKKLGYRFKKRQRLALALVHPSYRHENEGITDDNQRLEYLGDAALGLVVAADLYERKPDWDEGLLTQWRSEAANRKTLARIGVSWGLGEVLLLGRGEEQSGGRSRDSNLADAVEAILGAVYLDGGLKAVLKVYGKCWADMIDMPSTTIAGNPKGALQEYCQKKWKVSPTYRIVEEKGPPHAREYVCQALIKGKAYGTGQGMSKRVAESQAAQATLMELEK